MPTAPARPPEGLDDGLNGAVAARLARPMTTAASRGASWAVSAGLRDGTMRRFRAAGYTCNKPGLILGMADGWRVTAPA
jgi:hypothetical protein